MNKISKKWLWLIIFILFLIAIQFLNHTGFCYSQFKYLSNKELLDRFIFGDKANKMNEEEKKAFVEKRWNGAVYPDCCRIKSETVFLKNNPFRFWDITLVGQYLYEIRYLMPETRRLENTTREPFLINISALNSCGYQVGGGHRSIDISITDYNNALDRNKQYWKDNKK